MAERLSEARIVDIIERALAGMPPLRALDKLWWLRNRDEH